MARAPLIVTLLAALVATGCGAPAKSAGDVAYLFETPPGTLQDKVDGVCDELKSRDKAPTLSGLSINIDGCGNAGLMALNYSELDDFKFLGIENADDEKADEIRKTVRTQFWLNKTLLGFASSISGKFTGGENKIGIVDGPPSDKKLDSLIKTELNQIEPFHFDSQSFELGALLNVKASGIAKIDNDIRIDGKMLNGSFAVVIQTTEDKPTKESMIKSIGGLILIVPYASDIYLDMYLDITVNNESGLKSIFRRVITGVLSDNMKKIADTLLTL
jgi:hypothetical protein